MEKATLLTLATSLGLGLLVGLQREYTDHKIAGIRTITLVTLFGTIMGMVAQYWENSLVIAAGALAVAGLMVSGNVLKSKGGSVDYGQTTEVATLLMFGIGAYLVEGQLMVGVIAGGATALLLHLKQTLGDFVAKLSQKDIVAIMQFVAITLVILPILPDENYGPYEVLNPREIWWMVVLIVGLGLGGYFLYKWLGTNAGNITNGILGGLISSTATTITYAKRTKDLPKLARMGAFIVMAASTVSLVRILVEVGVVSPQHLGVIAPPMVAQLLVMALLCLGLYFFKKNTSEAGEEMPEPDNPAQLKTALIFGALYAVILVGVAAAKDYFGQNGLLVVSILSGFTDVDAITLSLANTLNRGDLHEGQAWKYMLVASFSNILFKGGMVVFLGSKNMAKFILPAFGIAIVAGLLIVWLWPTGWQF